MTAVNRTREMEAVNPDILLIFLDVLQTDVFEETITQDSFNTLASHIWVKERDILAVLRTV